MNPDYMDMDHDGVFGNHVTNPLLDEVVRAPSHEPFDKAAMENFLNHEWAEVDLLQGFENAGELGEPLNSVYNTPPEPLHELSVAAEHLPKHSPHAIGHRYICQACPFSSNIKRDYERHSRTLKHRKNTMIGGNHNAPESISPNTISFYCPVQGCKFNSDGKSFSRDDHLWRHIRKMHDIKKQM